MSCYNASQYLHESIESILNQTYSDYEFIIVNDGSTDDTLDIINRYASQDGRIVVVDKNNTGLADSLNMGIREAKGAWIARLDADDIALRNRLQSQLEFVEENSGIVLVGGGCIEINEIGQFIKVHAYPAKQEDLVKRLESWKAFFPHSSAFLNKESVVRLGGYNPRFTRSQDFDLWFRMGEVGQIACLPEPVVKLRKHSQMISKEAGGRLQLLLGLCATICHYRREACSSDPSRMGQKAWQEFLTWVEKRMDEEAFFQHVQKHWKLRDTVYNNMDATKVAKCIALLNGLIQYLCLIEPFNTRFKKNMIYKLAEESSELWQ